VQNRTSRSTEIRDRAPQLPRSYTSHLALPPNFRVRTLPKRYPPEKLTPPIGLIPILNWTTRRSQQFRRTMPRHRTPRPLTESPRTTTRPDCPPDASTAPRTTCWGGFTYSTHREISHIGRSPTKETHSQYATICLRPKWQPARRSVHPPDTCARTTIQVATRATDTGGRRPTLPAAGHNAWSLALPPAGRVSDSRGSRDQTI